TDMPFPVVLDARGTLAARLGVERTLRGGGRASFVADPAGRVRWTSASTLSPMRSLREAAEVLAALRCAAAPLGPRPRRHLVLARAWCHRMQDTDGWLTPESYVRRHTGADLTHGICTECLQDQSLG